MSGFQPMLFEFGQASLSPSPQTSTLLRVAIPHFYQPLKAQSLGYGSSREDAEGQRSVALARCIGAVLALARQPGEPVLDIAEAGLLQASAPSQMNNQLQGVVVDCHVFVNGDACIDSVLDTFGRRITVHRLQLDDPCRLPHAARDFLLTDAAAGDADLSLYLEDDLVVADRLYVDKYYWFLRKTNHQFSLMPHRFEFTSDHMYPRLFVDGPMGTTLFPSHHVPTVGAASGVFGQTIVEFDIASNPHSGSFVVSAQQRKQLASGQKIDDGFIGPLETVATFTVLQWFPVMKPSWPSKDFLLVEHAHPSFLAQWSRLRQSKVVPKHAS